MNPYAYQQAHLQQQQQQYQFPGQYTQQPQFYYLPQQPPADQTYAAQQLANPYAAFAYQNTQPAATVSQYSVQYQAQQVQGYTQNAASQPYSSSSVTSSTGFYSTPSQTQARQPTADERPPLPPEQSVSSAPPPLPPEPAPSSYSFPTSSSSTLTSSSQSVGQMTDAQKSYQEKYLQWQQQYAQWQAQHQNHPDKKQYQEWQKQMEQWQQQNQQLLEAQVANQQSQHQQQAVTGTAHQVQAQAVQQHQQEMYGVKQEFQGNYPQHATAQQKLEQPQYQGYQQHTQHGVQQGHSFYNQQQPQKPDQQRTASWGQSQPDQNQWISQNQYQTNTVVSYTLQNQGFYTQKQAYQLEQQQTPSWIHGQIGQDKQIFQNQYQSGTSQNPQQFYVEQGNEHHAQNQQPQEEQHQQQESRKPNWKQQQYYGQQSHGFHSPSKGSKLPEQQRTTNWGQSHQQHGQGALQDKESTPRWLQSGKNSTLGGQEQANVAAPGKSSQRPKWLQQGTSNQQQSTEKPQESLQQQTPVPKWLQGQAKTPEPSQPQGKQSPQKPIPKWLQDKPATSGKSFGTPGSHDQTPNWMKPNTSEGQVSSSSQQVTPVLSSGTKTPSKWDQEKKALSAAAAAAAVAALDQKKLSVLEQLELLRKQQEQLQQLQKLESRLKQAPVSSSSPAGSTSVSLTSSTSTVTTGKSHLATSSESWQQTFTEHQISQVTHGIEKQQSAINSKDTRQTAPKLPCKFFPNCRFGASCRFQHPPCQFGAGCQRGDCIFDHSEQDVAGEIKEESKYLGHEPQIGAVKETNSFQDDVVDSREGLLSFSSTDGQIPGIGDSDLPVVSTDMAVEDSTDQQLGEETEQDTSIWQDNNFEASEGDNRQDNSSSHQGEDTKVVDEGNAVQPLEGDHMGPYEGNKTDEDRKDTKNQWGSFGQWDGEHYLAPAEWDTCRSKERDRPWPPHPDRRGDGQMPLGDERLAYPRERDGEGEMPWDRGEERPPFDPDRRGPRSPFPRDDRGFGPPFSQHEGERRPPFPGDERDRWLPFPHDDRIRRGPYPRDRRDEGPHFKGDEHGRRPDWWDEHDARPPFLRDDRDRRPPPIRDELGRPKDPIDDLKRLPPFPRDERGGRPQFPRDDWGDRPPFQREYHDRKPSSQDSAIKEESLEPPLDKAGMKDERNSRPLFPGDEREGWPPLPRDGRDSRPPYPRDEPFMENERERRPPFLRDERPQFPRDERDSRPPFPRGEREGRPPFPPDDRDAPYPPSARGPRDRWPPDPRAEDDDRFWSRDRHPPGRPISPDQFGGRRGERDRERLLPEWDERARPLPPPPWSPEDRYRRERSPPGRDFRGRPPAPPKEFDRYGHPLPPPPHSRWPDREFFDDDRGRPPPRDWDRHDWRGPSDRGPPYPDDRWRRSPPPPHWDRGRERFPPDYPRDWDRFDYRRRGPDDFDRRGSHEGYYEGHPIHGRRSPYDEYHHDRPPAYDDYPPRYGSPELPPPHSEDRGHPGEVLQVEKKAETVPVESVFDTPGRDSRPDRIVVILRGPPGSGKTHVARLLKDKEVSYGAHAPRILALDDYFLVEVEKSEQDPETGKKVKKKVTEYVHEPEMEEAYASSMFKSFTKTLEEGFFPVVIVDAIHDKVEQFEKYWSHAKQKGFEVYVAELMADAHACAKRNSHNRTFEEINKMVSAWEETPVHHLRLDVRSLLQDAVITEVEMETAEEAPTGSAGEEEATKEDEVDEEPEIQVPKRSKWEEMEPAEDKLNKLDGIRPIKRRREESPPFALSDDDDPYDEREEDMRIGKKRVRWADLEEKKQLEHRRRIGFCIGTSKDISKEESSPEEKDKGSAVSEDVYEDRPKKESSPAKKGKKLVSTDVSGDRSKKDTKSAVFHWDFFL